MFKSVLTRIFSFLPSFGTGKSDCRSFDVIRLVFHVSFFMFQCERYKFTFRFFLN
ncbi:hypothetical protein HanIR_Chr09g0397321 [Helianthus annuus]|nr:hypothetical protein HanIR_Chr09g0397321 [Helianthus annuus]